ncbi:MAG: hypothetical protein DMF69_16750 [Acidobacteria bacterium]|nr:MAG: hypothetical protein DMF69_16750 [Acidobacteriota bacterium]
MKLIDFKNKLAGSLFAIALLFGIGLAANVTTQAQYQNDRYRRDQRDNRDYRRDNRDYREQRRRDSDNEWRNNGWNRGRYNDGYPDLGGSFNLRQTALNAGANEGIKAGRNDARRNRPYDFRDESAFQKATKDYSSRLGDRGIYMTYFRQAFAHAYADGYQGY